MHSVFNIAIQLFLIIGIAHIQGYSIDSINSKFNGKCNSNEEYICGLTCIETYMTLSAHVSPLLILFLTLFTIQTHGFVFGRLRLGAHQEYQVCGSACPLNMC
ncbi:unnamed protein product [Rotaria sordida]|uniref:Uncharacterized protein n=1 Tax=Rotaria sordida TaxID=392033 RepID=A0A816ACB4_9BILA|nr:unnamed protein product [Rotaria sordida]CAF1595790.1 unnamed protein product [Rotaria sordida]